MAKRKRLGEVHSNPRVKIHKDGRATLSGLSYEDLRSLICGASLNAYDGLKKAKKEKDREQRAESVAFYEQEIKLTKLADEAMQEQFRLSWKRPERVPTKAERLAAVTHERKERLLLNSIIDDLIAARHSKTPLKPLTRLLDE